MRMRIDEFAYEGEFCNCTSLDMGRKDEVSKLEPCSQS